MTVDANNKDRFIISLNLTNDMFDIICIIVVK